MEIQSVDSFVVGTPAPYKGGRNWVFVKVETDDGTVGWGECNWSEYRIETLQQAIDELKDRFVVGFDPFEIERLRERIDRSSHFLHVPGPVNAQVASAIEMACWDIVGKAVGEPVYKLLGGKCHEEVRSYTYMHYEWEPPQPPEKAAKAARHYVDQGFTGLKLDPLHPINGPRSIPLEQLEYAESIVAAVREEVGDQCDILVGTHGQLPTQAAIRLARRIEPYDPLWLEEPVPPENVGEMAKVADSTTIPIATGERVTSIHQFSELLESGAVQIVQPNVGLLGILGTKKVAAMAEAHYAEVAPWLYCGPVAGAANLHVDACTPNFLVQESIERMDGFHADVLEEPLDWADGSLAIPSGPGLGVTPDESVLRSRPENELPAPGDRPHYSFERNEEKLETPEAMD
ncbi:mandelate racemase/muconate lactonizing enzyme family protein [Haloplanus sp. GCM10025708]|uniref:mandelate racemase/muconate lactonizing enzyme family protein n=1 Tax=Haloferacaceae TaxID=1644056 RepID=UPI00361AD878